MNAESLEFLPVGIKDFLDTYFKNKGETFINLIDSYEGKVKGEQPF
ncbi:MAG: hypothetical protein IPJ32_10485 [Sphingobacteriaceae bacterium]|nr:hypothetical protein [Sphingobacteriaceae bacterium]